MPIMASCHSQVEVMVAPAKRPDETVSSGGGLAMTTNLGSGIHFHMAGLHGGIFTHWVKIFGTSVLRPGAIWVEVVTVERMTMGFKCLRKRVVEKEPQGWTSIISYFFISWLPELPLLPPQSIGKGLPSPKVIEGP